MKKFWIGLVALFATSIAGAATIDLSWTNPVQNTDGTALTDAVETRVYYDLCADGVDLGDTTVTASWPAESAVVDITTPGDWCFRAVTVNSFGNQSVFSNEASATVPEPVPNAPGGLQTVLRVTLTFETAEGVQVAAQVE